MEPCLSALCASLMLRTPMSWKPCLTAWAKKGTVVLQQTWPALRRKARISRLRSRQSHSALLKLAVHVLTAVWAQLPGALPSAPNMKVARN